MHQPSITPILITMKYLQLLITILSISQFSCAQNQPLQPTSGPGGSDYTHGNVVMSDFTSLLSGESYWLFEPTAPTVDSANLIIFVHGYGVNNPGPYGAWIEHLVRKGNIVVYPKYQINATLTLPSQFTPNTVTAILNSINELNTNPNRTKPRLQNIALIGHSYGGVISSNLATEYQSYGIPKPKCFMLCEPGTSILTGGRLDSYSNMDDSYSALIIVGADDAVVGDSFGREIMDSTSIPTSRKNYIIHHEDSHGDETIAATHDEPLAANSNYDGGVLGAIVTGAYAMSKENTVDYYCYWKLGDALLDCSFNNLNCNYAFGDTQEQKNMGQWSDGQEVVKLTVRPSITVGINNTLETNKLNIYPNPSSSFFTINTNEPAKLILIDSTGRTVYQNNNYTGERVQTQAFENGVYKALLQTQNNETLGLNTLVINH